MTLTVSVIVCSYNRCEILADCLASFQNQEVDKQTYEIIVVNNNSTDDTEQIVHDAMQQNERIRYCKEVKQGLSHARNRGAKEAKTNWLVYLDDDAKVFPNFIQRIIEVSSTHDFDCYGGVYLPWYRYGKPKWLPPTFGSNAHVAPKSVGYYDGFAPGGIFLIQKTALDAIGGFDPNLGMIGNKIAYGEETRVQIDLRAKGYKIGLDPELKILHLVNRHKLSPRWFMNSAFAAGTCHWGTFSQKPSFLIWLRTTLKRNYLDFKAIGSVLQGKTHILAWGLNVLRSVAYSLGMIKGWVSPSKH